MISDKQTLRGDQL